MKNCESQLRDINESLNEYLFKDDYYNYCLIGRELVLRPLGHRKEKRYQLNDSELSQLIDYYVTPLKKLRNEHLYIEYFQMEILDIEDDMMAFIDSLI